MGKSEQAATLDTAKEAYAREIERRVRTAVDDIVSQGRVPSFYTVADAARVARSTLYRKSELKELVEWARSSSSEPTATTSRLEALKRENELLRDELKRVRQARASYWVVPLGEAA